MNRSATAPQFKVESVSLAELPVRLRLPFRFGLITLTHAPQAFVSVRLRFADGKSVTGLSASMLVPKWFDKAPDRDNDTNIEHLRRAIKLTADAYQSESRPLAAFNLHASQSAAIQQAAAREAINPLTAGFGPAILDAAIADAIAQYAKQSFYSLVQHNLLGLAPEQLLAEFKGFDIDHWLAELSPATKMAARHTVGLVDPIGELAASERVTNDGLPESLPEIIGRYGHRHFKLKVSGDQQADLERLQAIAAVLDQSPEPYLATLDGNEQFTDIEPVQALWTKMTETASLKRLVDAIVFIEQPIARTKAMTANVSALASDVPLIIDESDDSLNAFPMARDLGYAGVSSKLCKGFYKSLINAARCSRIQADGGVAFMSAEDLTNQAGVAVQQDLALVSLLGLEHVERNGHHYVDGFGETDEAVQQAFARDHADLYQTSNTGTRLHIANGHLDIGSLVAEGFALGKSSREAVLKSIHNPQQEV